MSRGRQTTTPLGLHSLCLPPAAPKKIKRSWQKRGKKIKGNQNNGHCRFPIFPDLQMTHGRWKYSTKLWPSFYGSRTVVGLYSTELCVNFQEISFYADFSEYILGKNIFLPSLSQKISIRVNRAYEFLLVLRGSHTNRYQTDLHSTSEAVCG